MQQGAWRAVAVSGSVGVTWLIVVALAAAASASGVFRGAESAVLPTVTPFLWAWPSVWALLFSVAGAAAVALVHAAILAVVAQWAGAAGPARTWLAAVIAGAVVGMTIDVALVFGSLFTNGWVMWALDLGSRAAIGAYWGLLFGWVPALVGARLAKVAEGAASEGRSTVHTWVPVVAAVAALVVVTAVQTGGHDASQAIAVQEASAAQAAAAEAATGDGAAPPDPSAEGTPAPETAPGEGTTAADGCTPPRAMLMLGMSDAATGHRGQPIRLVNTSDEPCVIEGYPDIAFADQNGHELAVTIEQGGSFMAQDPGATRVEIPAGGTAIAYLGWDAASTHGAIIARTLLAAPLAGDRREGVADRLRHRRGLDGLSDRVAARHCAFDGAVAVRSGRVPGGWCFRSRLPLSAPATRRP